MNEFKKIPASRKSISLRKPVYGFGINDADYVVAPTINGKQITCPYYRRWSAMLKRCYLDEYQLKNPTYIGCTVAPVWLLFSNFKSWMQAQDWQDNHLDKDIINPNNKLYSPDNCIFVTQEINKLLTDSGSARGKYPQGVCFSNKHNKLLVKCGVEGKRKHLGYFTCQNEAEKAYLKCKIQAIKDAASTQREPIRSGLLSHAKIKQCRLDEICMANGL